MSDAVRRYERYVVRTTGDGVFALFGAPVAYEDHPQRALYAALQMQQELRAYAKDRAAKALPALEARVGVHTGEVVAYPGEASGKVEYRLIGHTANLAARMESIAAVEANSVNEATAKLCPDYFELRELGPRPLRGAAHRLALTLRKSFLRPTTWGSSPGILSPWEFPVAPELAFHINMWKVVTNLSQSARFLFILALTHLRSRLRRRGGEPWPADPGEVAGRMPNATAS